MREDPIVVGYDGSGGAYAALGWGMSEAALRRLPANVVTVVEPHGEAVERARHDLTHAPVVEAESALAEVVSGTSAKVAVEVAGRVVVGPVAGTLCELSRGASLLVLGGRGVGGFAGLPVGSVSLAVAAHADCPVVVVRECSHPAAECRVLLGVDDCPAGRLAAEFAFQEAAVRGVGLCAVRAVPTRGRWSTDEWSGSQRALLDDVLADCRSRYADVDIVTRVVAGSPGEVLAGESRQAQLLVVGSRGGGGFHGLLLGSVSRQVLHHAHCPVAVVREHHTPTPPASVVNGAAHPMAGVTGPSTRAGGTNLHTAAMAADTDFWPEANTVDTESDVDRCLEEAERLVRTPRPPRCNGEPTVNRPRPQRIGGVS